MTDALKPTLTAALALLELLPGALLQSEPDPERRQSLVRELVALQVLAEEGHFDGMFGTATPDGLAARRELDRLLGVFLRRLTDR